MEGRIYCKKKIPYFTTTLMYIDVDVDANNTYKVSQVLIAYFDINEHVAILFAATMSNEFDTFTQSD